MTENREYCKRVAQEVELYASGDGYRCPKCGEVITFNNDQYNEEETLYTCQECGEEFDESELEAVSLYDYAPIFYAYLNSTTKRRGFYFVVATALFFCLGLLCYSPIFYVYEKVYHFCTKLE